MCFCLSNRKQGGISKSLEMCIFKCELGLKLGKLAFKNPSLRLRHFLFCSETYLIGPFRDNTRFLKQGSTLCWCWYQPLVRLVLVNLKFCQRKFFCQRKLFFSKVVHFSKKMISILTLSRKRKFRLKVGTNFGTTCWCWYQHSVVPCFKVHRIKIQVWRF